ncbi:MAG: hypothetical protein ACTHN0_13685 [Aquihabitans sp.]
MRRGLVAALLLALPVLAGCSGSSDGAATTTAVPTTTTTTKPEITDQEIVDDINERIRPSLEAKYDADQVDCIIGVLQDGGVGKLSADAVVPAYQERCGVTATEVTGVITASALVERGAAKEAAACVAGAIAELTYDDVAALGEDGTNQLYERCGIDVEALSGG